MRKSGSFVKIFCFLLAAFVVFVTNYGIAGAREKHINIVKVSDTINPGTADFIKKAVRLSEDEKAACLIIQLDTPGGLVTSMRHIVRVILNATVPVVVYVSPSGAQAASAGTFITMAAHVAAMAPGTNIGAAHPVTAGGKDMQKTMNEKVVNDLVAFAKSIAAQRGRNKKWAQKAVRKSVSITATEALKLKVIDIVARDMDDLISKLDGRKIKLGKETVTLKLKGLPRNFIEETFRDRILRTLSNPNIAYILMMIGLAGLYFELAHPGAILPGVVGGISLILAFFALQTLPVNYAGFLLIALAIVFFILEIKVTSYGMLSVAGIISLILGSLMLFPDKGQYVGVSLKVLLPTSIIISAFFVTVASLAFKAHLAKPKTGTAGIIGEFGEVREVKEGSIKVFVHGEIWNAVSEDKLEKGDCIRVEGMENLKLQVKRFDDKNSVG